MVRTILLSVFFTIIFSVSIQASALRPKEFKVPDTHKPSQNGYQYKTILNRLNTQTDVELKAYAHEKMSGRFKIEFPDGTQFPEGTTAQDWIRLNSEVMAIIEHYLEHIDNLPPIDPIWFLAQVNEEFKEYEPTYLSDFYFANWIMNIKLYKNHPYNNYLTGFGWKSVLETYREDYKRTFQIKETLIWKYPYNFFWFMENVIVRTSPIIPQDYGLIFTHGNVPRRDVWVEDQEFADKHGTWQAGMVADRWSYVDALNKFWGATDEWHYLNPGYGERAEMETHYETAVVYMNAYENREWSLLGDESFKTEVNYNYINYFGLLMSTAYEYKFGKFRYQKPLMEVIEEILENDPRASYNILCKFYAYIHMEARYTGEW